MMLKDDLRYFFRKAAFILPLILILIFSFGYGVLHPAMGIDDLCREHYTTDGVYIGYNRLGGWITMMLLGPTGHTNLIQETLGVLFLGLAAILLCILFRRASRDSIPSICYTLFACLFVSYPLNMNIWVYADTGFMVKLGYALLALSMLLIDDFFQSRRKSLLLAACLLVAFSVGMFESMAAVFIFYVGAYLFLQELARPAEQKKSPLIRRGLLFAGILLAGILLNALLCRLLMAAFDIPAINQSTQAIGWFNGKCSFGSRVKIMLGKIISDYILTGLFSWPLALHSIGYLISVGLAVVVLKKERPWALLAILIMCVSTIAMMVVKGNLLPLRTAQAIAPFSSFLFMLLCMGALRLKKVRALGISVAALLFALSFCQSAWLNQSFEWDAQRFSVECRIMDDLHNRLDTGYPIDEKPVVFLQTPTMAARTQLPSIFPESDVDRSNSLYEFLHGRIQFLPESLPLLEYPRSMIGWAIGAFGPNQELYRFFQYLGYTDLILPSEDQLQRASASLDSVSSYPHPGCIRDMGDYILVKFG